MQKFWYISGDFHKERSTRIGTSEFSAMIPDPEKPNESLAGYGQTAVTLWQEKTGRKKRDPAGLPAEMGHYLENKALELFIRQECNYQDGIDFRRKKEQYESLNAESPGRFNACNYQLEGPDDDYFHNTQYYNDQFIAHPDMIWCNNSVIAPARYAIVEAKSASYWSAKRREGSLTRGYDLDLKSWHGIPLKHYMQIQFQLALFEIDTAYLALLYDTSQFHTWKIEANKNIQNQIIDLAGKMAWHIKNDTPPKNMAMNQKDIAALYPDIKDDFRVLKGLELASAKKYARAGKLADKKIKRWKEIKTDAVDGLSVLLKEYGEIMEGSDSIAKWGFTKKSEKSRTINQIKNDFNEKDYKRIRRYYEKNNLIIPPGEPSRSVKISFKE